MNGRNGLSPTRILAMTALAAVVLLGSRPVAADPGDSLKWTPHRASMPKATDEPMTLAAPAPVQATEADASSKPAPPASVVLPDHVPTIDTVATAPSPRAASRPRRPAPPRVEPETSGLATRLYDPANPDALFGVRVIRTPQPPANGGPRMAAAPRASQAAANQRLGGGLAPRYSPSASQRPERLAMNVDGIPSVMRQPAPPRAADPAAVPDTSRDRLPTPADDIPGEPGEAESIGPGLELPHDAYGYDMPGGYAGGCAPGECDGLLMGEYPTEMHVESFYDDPYACDEEENEDFLQFHDGRICRWLRQFGRPYYGWRWYRDFTASAGVTSFANPTDLGINGNYGTNEYLNWAMPFWNAFGVGWQVGWRGTQTNFQPATLEIGGTTISKNARDQNFLTTGFFTRAFEGRGVQGGIVYDYMHDSWFENTDVAQLRYELSYVWGYHEFGFWGASNIADDLAIFGRQTPDPLVASTLSLYTGFYRVQFGDANEFKVWGGGTGNQDGIIGALVRTPLHPSLAVESTFTYIIPNRNHEVTLGPPGDQSTFAPSAWNLGINLVWYPANRSRRSLASPYRPLFEVADNGSMIRALEGL
jgi:hypothetical protein